MTVESRQLSTEFRAISHEKPKHESHFQAQRSMEYYQTAMNTWLGTASNMSCVKRRTSAGPPPHRPSGGPGPPGLHRSSLPQIRVPSRALTAPRGESNAEWRGK